MGNPDDTNSGLTNPNDLIAGVAASRGGTDDRATGFSVGPTAADLAKPVTAQAPPLVDDVLFADSFAAAAKQSKP